MIKDCPENIENPEYLGPFLAGAAHKLANDFKLELPIWVFDPKFYLPGNKPYFGSRATKKLRTRYLLFETPAEFSHRNIFVSSNCLSRA